MKEQHNEKEKNRNKMTDRRKKLEIKKKTTLEIEAKLKGTQEQIKVTDNAFKRNRGEGEKEF